MYCNLLDQSTNSTFSYERIEYPKAISHQIYNFCFLGRRMHMVKAKFDECLAISNNDLSFALYWKYGRKYNYDTNYLRQLFCTTKRNCCIVLCTVYLFKSFYTTSYNSKNPKTENNT